MILRKTRLSQWWFGKFGLGLGKDGSDGQAAGSGQGEAAYRASPPGRFAVGGESGAGSNTAAVKENSPGLTAFLAVHLQQHLRDYGTGKGGRLFWGTRSRERLPSTV
ncbi:hypothetical protein GCM10020366_64210 [Saccharopolyspora gregorii]|uniref:Uncharacterized protein n=1 Tax=Saccharopolyspora gregorii TaxID=33914 RepID=A0ABP6S0W7_9PSEU